MSTFKLEDINSLSDTERVQLGARAIDCFGRYARNHAHKSLLKKLMIYSGLSLPPFIGTTRTEEAQAYEHYGRQIVKRNFWGTLRALDWDEVYYKSNNGVSDTIPGFYITDAIGCIIRNYRINHSIFEERAEEVKRALGRGNLTVLSNHCTWLNLPIFGAYVHQVYGVPLTKINLITGPTVPIYEQGREIPNAFNCYLTIPNTPNGRLDTIAPSLQKRVSKSFKELIFDRLKNETGHVFLLAAYGTTDRQLADKVQILKAAPSVQRFLDVFQAHSHILPIASNSLEVFQRLRPRIGNVYLSARDIIPPCEAAKNAILELEDAIPQIYPNRNIEFVDESNW